MSERKAFNFFKSYYDVFKELPTKDDKLFFIEALLDRQFTGQEPKDMQGMSRFAYISQKHNIDSQVKGFEDKTGVKLTPTDGGFVTPTVQVKGKEKVIVIEKEEVIEKVIVKEQTNKSKTQKRVFSEEVKNCLRNCLEYFDKSEHPDNFEKWLDTVEKLNTIEKIPFELIEHIVKLTKNDEFWSANFQSITKLRKKNKDGIKYIKYFYNKFKIQNEKSKSNTDNHLQRLRAENPGLYKML